jgi:hypothetical protein
MTDYPAILALGIDNLRRCAMTGRPDLQAVLDYIKQLEAQIVPAVVAELPDSHELALA